MGFIVKNGILWGEILPTASVNSAGVICKLNVILRPMQRMSLDLSARDDDKHTVVNDELCKGSSWQRARHQQAKMLRHFKCLH